MLRHSFLCTSLFVPAPIYPPRQRLGDLLYNLGVSKVSMNILIAQIKSGVHPRDIADRFGYSVRTIYNLKSQINTGTIRKSRRGMNKNQRFRTDFVNPLNRQQMESFYEEVEQGRTVEYLCQRYFLTVDQINILFRRFWPDRVVVWRY